MLTLKQTVEPYDKDIIATYESLEGSETVPDISRYEDLELNELLRLHQRLFDYAMEWATMSPATVQADIEDTISIVVESPFDELDEWLDDDVKVQKLISYIRSELGVPFAERLSSRLEFLMEVAKEEEPEEVAISPESLRNFVSFLQSTVNLNYPDIMLSPSKNIRVQWRTAPNRHFVVEFMPIGDAQFVIFSPDPNYPEKTVRLSGLAAIDSLLEIVTPHGVLDWAT